MHPLYKTETQVRKSFEVPEDYSLIILGAGLLFYVFVGLIAAVLVISILYIYGLVKTAEDPDFFHIFWMKHFVLKRTRSAFQFKGRRYAA